MMWNGLNIKNVMNDVCEKWKNIREKEGEMTGKKDILRRCLGEVFPPP